MANSHIPTVENTHSSQVFVPPLLFGNVAITTDHNLKLLEALRAGVSGVGSL